jgi:hypothetical protein
LKFALLAACVASAAALGGVVGAVGAAGVLTPSGGADSDTAAEIAAIKNIVGQLTVDIGMMKANQEQSASATRAQLEKASERLARMEKIDTDPSAKMNKVLESLQRLEQRAGVAVGKPEATGSLAPPPAAAEAKRPIVDGWVLRRVYDGVALIQSRRGAIEIEAGERLPGLGRVEEIKRQDGHWVVVTSRGLIVPAR